MYYGDVAVMTIWDFITEYIHNDEVLNLKEISDKWIRMKLHHNESLGIILFQVEALCAAYLTKCHIRKLDPENLVLVIKEVPTELKYQLSLLERSFDGMGSGNGLKPKLSIFLIFPSIHQSVTVYPKIPLETSGSKYGGCR